MLDTSPAIRIRGFLQIAPYLARRGISSIDFFERLGISPNVFQNVENWLPRAQCFQVANEMASVANDRFAGAHVGYSIQLRELGAWGEAVLKAADIGHACAVAAAGAHMLHRGSSVRFTVEGNTARIFFRFEERCEFDPQQFVFGTLAVLRKIPLLAGDPSAVRMRLSAKASRNSDQLEACLGPNIEMGCDDDVIEFDRALLDMPLTVDEDRQPQATQALRTTVATARLISETLADPRKLNTTALAMRLGMSTRTLQRRLKYCGVVFEDLLD